MSEKRYYKTYAESVANDTRFEVFNRGVFATLEAAKAVADADQNLFCRQVMRVCDGTVAYDAGPPEWKIRQDAEEAAKKVSR